MSHETGPLLVVGSYTNSSSVGIHTFCASETDGTLTPRSQTDAVEHASFLTPHPDGRTVYAVSESVDDGSIVALRLDPVDGSLTEIDRAPSHGAAPCHVSVDHGGRHVHVANYVSGTVAAYSLTTDGRFDRLAARVQHEGSGPHPRQQGPHTHSVVPDPHGHTLYVVDLGTDEIRHYASRPDPSAGLRPTGVTTLSPGSGPRHLSFHPRHAIAFVVGELDSTLTSFDVDRTTGELHFRQRRSTLPHGYRGESTAADVHVHPNGRTVYVSNRGHDSIAAFAFDEHDHDLTFIGHAPSGGRTPRNFTIHPEGDSMLVANQDSGTIVSVDIDPSSGNLSGSTVVAQVDEPVCVVFIEATP
jgi:6-phosphogluconolactonase